MKRERQYGFTLIELLIVIAIIGILAAIAVPNFLNAQLRAKVSRVYSDHRGFATAMESYNIDHNNFPYGIPCSYIQYQWVLTTPVSYIADITLPDPFGQPPSKFALNCPDWKGTYHYVNYGGYWGLAVYGNWAGRPKAYTIMSYGPDKHQNGAEHFIRCWDNVSLCAPDTNPQGNPWNLIYSSSNGLVSGGDIARTGGGAHAPLVIGG